MEYIVTNTFNEGVNISNEIYYAILLSKSKNNKLLFQTSEGVWEEVNILDYSKEFVINNFVILGTHRGSKVLSTIGATTMYAQPLQRLDGKWVIPNTSISVDLSNFQYSIEEYQDAWFD